MNTKKGLIIVIVFLLCANFYLTGIITEKEEEAKSKIVATNPFPVVYITNSGEKYHQFFCRSLDRSSKPMHLYHALREYEPCKECKPPVHFK